MSQVRLRQVARLKKRALPYIERKLRPTSKQRASLCDRAFVIAADLALLILHGDPKTGEPLSCAWQRCLELKSWISCCERYPEVDDEVPFDEHGAREISRRPTACEFPSDCHTLHLSTSEAKICSRWQIPQNEPSFIKNPWRTLDEAK